MLQFFFYQTAIIELSIIISIDKDLSLSLN